MALDKDDLLGRNGRKTNLLYRGKNLLRKMEYYEDEVRCCRNWVNIIEGLNNPMQLLFDLFDSTLSPKPEVANKAQDRLGILLCKVSKLPRHPAEEQTVRRAISYFAQNSHNLAKKIEKQVVTGNQKAKSQAQHYACLTERIANAFDDVKLYPADVTASLMHSLALWRWVSKRENTPIKVTHQDLTVATATKQPEPHVRA